MSDTGHRAWCRGSVAKRATVGCRRPVQARALELVREERYADFGPTLAREKLRELHGVDVARETLRKWMAGAGIWLTRDKRRAKNPHVAAGAIIENRHLGAVLAV